MIGLRLMLLGGFEARLASGESVSLPTKKGQALLAYLGARSGERHSRDKLAALLWGGKRDERARGDLRHALGALRRALAGADPPALRIESQTLALNADAVDVDVVTFERRVADGSTSALEQAVELYRGDLLLGVNVNEPLFEEWLVTERERLREVAMEALAKLLAHQTKAGATERAIQTAVRLLGLDPLQEATHRTLMRLYRRQGRRGAALKQYQACVATLQRELGTTPESETKQLYQELLRRPAGAAESSSAHTVPRSRARRLSVEASPDLPAADTPLFGRQVELGQLRKLLDDASQGQGHSVTVVGEAGIGKTLLVSTLAPDALAQGYRVLIGHCHESDSILPFGPWVEACRSGGLGDDVLSALNPRWRAELTRLLPEVARAGLPATSNSALPLFEGVAALLEQIAARQPLLLVLEDLHWADEMSLRLLAFVSRRVPAWPACLIATARDDELAEDSIARRTLDELSGAPQAIALALSPLSRDDTARLVRALSRVGRDPATVAHVETRIWDMSEGNPFVVVEAMRAIAQRSLDIDEPGLIPLPARVRTLVARRLDRLGPRAQEVAAVAAIIGRQFDFTLLRSASGLEERQAAEAVEEMVRDRVLQAIGDQLDFTHERIREVAYGRLLPPRRKLVHRAVVEALEALRQDLPTGLRAGLDEHVEQLAHHALRGELWQTAVPYLRHAGVKAAARSALHDAQAWFERALDAVSRLPESRSTLEESFEIRLELRPVLTQLGEVRQTLEHLREAERLADRLDDDPRRGRVYAFLTNLRAMVGELDEARVTGTRALDLAQRLDDVKLRILATTYLEVTLYYQGEYERVVELATDNLATVPADRLDEYLGMPAPPPVYDRGNLVVSLAELGRFAEAATHEAEAVRLADVTRHAYTVGFAARTASVPHLLRGDWARALARLHHGIAVLPTGNVPLLLPILVSLSAWALAQLGKGNEALTRLREGQRLLEEQAATGLLGQSGWLYHALGRACLALGSLDEARRLGERALESSPRHPGFEAHARHLLGDIAAGFDAERAESHYHQALALAKRLGMRPLVAHCHLGLGDVARRMDRSAEAREHLAAATAMYREMDMPFWLKTAEA